jgi:hypothetical protein
VEDYVKLKYTASVCRTIYVEDYVKLKYKAPVCRTIIIYSSGMEDYIQIANVEDYIKLKYEGF